MEKWQNYSRGCTSCGPHILTLHGKPYFLFPDVLKRWFFQKNWAEIWSFLYYWGRWYFFSSKIWSCTLKMKNDLSQKNTRKHYISFPLKNGLFKKDHAGLWSLLYYLKRWYFFQKTWYFFLGQGAGGDLSQEIHGDMIFSVYTYMCYKRGATALCQKTSKMVLSSKNTPSGDWCSRFASYKKLQQFSVLSWRPLQACSCIALQRSEKKKGNLIYRIEVWLLLQFVQLEVFYNE